MVFAHRNGNRSLLSWLIQNKFFNKRPEYFFLFCFIFPFNQYIAIIEEIKKVIGKLIEFESFNIQCQKVLLRTLDLMGCSPDRTLIRQTSKVTVSIQGA